MSIYSRKEGEEQPYWKIGMMKIRLPFIHHRLEIPEFLQGLVLFAIGLSVIPIMENNLGFSYEAALASVIIFQFLMMIPSMMGVPFVAGQLTPMIPIVIAYLANFEPGPEAIQAMVALQLSIAVIFFFMGITGLGEKLTRILPSAIRGGIILGAGFAAILGQIQSGGELITTPISLTIGAILCLFIMYSLFFRKLAAKNKFWRLISNAGILTPILIAIAIGIFVQEYSLPSIEWGIVIPAVGELWQYTSFSVGFPSFEIWMIALPNALVAYIIAYGDIVVGNELLETTKSRRKDEKIVPNVGLLHYTVALRNLLLSLFSPHPGMAGPIFTAGMATVTERYKKGKRAMESFFSGANSFVLGVFLPLLALPLVTLFQPYLPIALSLTLIITGYVCIVVGLSQLNTDLDRGIAGIMALVLAAYGAALGLLLGVVLYLILYFSGNKKKQANINSEEEKDVNNL